MCTRPSRPKWSMVPRPLRPSTPEACASSTIIMAPWRSAAAVKPGSAPMSPSMENTPSVINSLRPETADDSPDLDIDQQAGILPCFDGTLTDAVSLGEHLDFHESPVVVSVIDHLLHLSFCAAARCTAAAGRHSPLSP